MAFVPPAQGNYRADVIETGFELSKEKQTPTIVIQVKLRCLIDNSGPEPRGIACQQLIRTVKLAITDTTIEYAMKKLRHAGWAGDDMMECSLDGMEVELVCSHTRGDAGKVYDNWDLALPPKERKEVAHDNSAKSAIARMMNRHLKANPATHSGVPSRPAVDRDIPEQGDDEVPF